MAQVRDPVCGMTVDTEKAPALLAHGSHTHYFCSADCRRRFEADPAQYGDEHAAHDRFVPERHEPPHTTTGRFTVPKFGSAGSGGLEYEPLPEAHDHERGGS